MSISLYCPKIHSEYKKGSLQLIMLKKFRKSQLSNFCHYFIFYKKPKISNLSHDKAPEFQNSVTVA